MTESQHDRMSLTECLMTESQPDMLAGENARVKCPGKYSHTLGRNATLQSKARLENPMSGFPP